MVARRAAVAGKLRGLTGNAMVDIRDAVRAIAGQSYVGVQVTDATLSIVTLTEVIEVYSRQIEQTDDIACLSLLHKGLPAEYQKV